MLIGYMRVSKADGSQVLDLQRDALIAAGVPSSRLYEDQASGKQDDRPGLAACLNTIHDLLERKIGFRVLAGQGANIDTTTAGGRLVIDDEGQIYAHISAFEDED